MRGFDWRVLAWLLILSAVFGFSFGRAAGCRIGEDWEIKLPCRFQVTTEAGNRLNLTALCESFVNDLWIPDHLSSEQAAHFALDYLKRTVEQEIKLLNLSRIDRQPG